jgi:esterase
MSYRSMASDVVAWLDRHGVDQAVLVGHSMGGKVAQAAALLHPGRVSGLVVLDIAPVRYDPHSDPSWKAVGDIVSVLASIDVQPGMSRSQADQLMRSAIPDPALRAFCLTNLDPKAGRWKVPLPAIASNLDRLADFDVPAPPHHQYTGDAFFIHGGQSRFVRSSHIPAIASYFPNHLLTTIRGAGHWIHAEAPDDTTALLKKFLDR